MAEAELPSNKRAAYHHGALRDTLLAQARRAIEKGGVAALSIRALAQEAGVAHRAAYRHFKDKDDLLAATFALAYGRLEKCIQAHAKAPEIRQRLLDMAVAYAEFCFEEPHMFIAMVGPRVNRNNSSRELEQALRAALAPLVDAIREGQAAGTLSKRDDPQAAAVMFWAALQGIVIQIIHKRIRVKDSLREHYIRDVATRLIGAALSA